MNLAELFYPKSPDFSRLQVSVRVHVCIGKPDPREVVIDAMKAIGRPVSQA